MLSFYRYLYQKIHINTLPSHKRGEQSFTTNNKGAAALEFAIVFPVFIMACFGVIYVFMLYLPQLTARYINFEAARYIGSGSSNIASLNYACTDHGTGAGVGAIVSNTPHPLLNSVNINPNSTGTISNGSSTVRLSGDQLSAQASLYDSSLAGVACKLLHMCSNTELGDFSNESYSAVVATPNPFMPCNNSLQ